jgi:hypothetical protein
MEEEEEALQMEEEEEALQMEEEEEALQMAKPTNRLAKAVKKGGRALARAKRRLKGVDEGGSEELPAGVRAQFEETLGADFSEVRIHVGGKAEAVGAKAYAAGTDIHFKPGEYNPGSQGGKELIGHELAHIVQQRAGRVDGFGGTEAMEDEAWELGRKAASGKPVEVPGAQSKKDERGRKG